MPASFEGTLWPDPCDVFSSHQQTLLPKVLMVLLSVSGSGTGYFLGDYNHSERSLVAFHRVLQENRTPMLRSAVCRDRKVAAIFDGL